jgi:hypothetical protein
MPVGDDWLLLNAFLGAWKGGTSGADEAGMCFRNAEVAAACLMKLGCQVTPLKVYIEVEGWPRREPPVVLGSSPLTHQGQRVGPGAWVGHVVLIVNGRWLVDVSTGQYNSPLDGLDVPPCLVCAWTAGAKNQVRIRNVTVTYWAAPTSGDDWRAWWNPTTTTSVLNLQPMLDATRALVNEHGDRNATAK